MSTVRSRGGMTLLELITVLAILGITLGIAGFAFRGWADDPGDGDDPQAMLASARSEALATGRPVTVTSTVNGESHVATALPDGSIIGDTIFGVDRLTGRPSRAP